MKKMCKFIAKTVTREQYFEENGAIAFLIAIRRGREQRLPNVPHMIRMLQDAGFPYAEAVRITLRSRWSAEQQANRQ